MSTDLRALADRAEKLHDTWRRGFAGQSRISRDLATLDRLIGDTASLRSQVEAAPSSSDLLAVVRERMALYERERDEIARLQDGGPDEYAGHRIEQWTHHTQARYRRLFAGQNRATRDPGLLREMAADQRRWRDALAVLMGRKEPGWRADLLDLATRNAELYEREAGEIERAYDAASADQRVGLLATTANAQFALWRRHFADRPRSSRRPPLLERIIGNLERILARMEAHRDTGVRTPAHLGNIDKVRDRIRHHRSELQQIVDARGRTGPDGIASGLADEANGWFAKYREHFAGKPRAGRDPSLLADICEGLHEVARAMDELDRTWSLPVNAKNLDIVLENLKRYEREYPLVVDANA